MSKILYTDWIQEQGIKTTDPFAMDPALSNPLPLLINPEQIGTVPIFSDDVITRSPEGTPSLRRPADGPEAISGDPSSIPPSSFSLPRFSHTPLIWDALQSRYGKDDNSEKKRRYCRCHACQFGALTRTKFSAWHAQGRLRYVTSVIAPARLLFGGSGAKQSLFSPFDLSNGTLVSIADTVPEFLTSSFNLESLAKPLLYTDWIQDQGIKTTDPFAVDPALSNPLPLLVNSETLGIVPAFSNPTVILSPSPVILSEAKNLDPSAGPSVGRPQDDTVSDDSTLSIPHSRSYTPLIWDALQYRYNNDKVEGKKKRSDALAFIKWKRNNYKARLILLII